MENRKIKKRKGYGAQSAEERKNRRKLFKLKSKERGTVELSSCLLNVAGPKEKNIRWEKEAHIQETNTKNLSEVENSKKRVKRDLTFHRTKSNRVSSFSKPNNESDYESLVLTEAPLSSSDNEIITDTSRLFPNSHRSRVNEKSGSQAVHSYLNTTESTSTTSSYNHLFESAKKTEDSNSQDSKKRSSKITVRSYDDNSSNLKDFTNTPTTKVQRLDSKNSARYLNLNRESNLVTTPVRQSHSKTRDSIQSTIKELRRETSQIHYSNNEESNFESDDDVSEFCFARPITNKDKDRGRNIFSDESQSSGITSCKSDIQNVLQTRKQLYFSDNDERTNKNVPKSAPSLHKPPHQNQLISKNLTKPAYQSELDVDTKQLFKSFKRISDKINISIKSAGMLTPVTERVLIDTKKIIVDSFQELVKIKEKIIVMHDNSQTYFNQCFEKAAKFWGIEKVKAMFIRCFKLLFSHEISLDTAFSFSKCMEFFTEIKGRKDDRYQSPKYPSDISSVSKTMMKIIFDIDVIVCTFKVLGVCIKCLSKENMNVISLHTIDASLHSIYISLAYLDSMDIKKLTVLLTEKNLQNVEELWNAFTKVIQNAHLMPTYASLEIVLKIILKVRCQLMDLGTTIEDEHSVDSKYFFAEKLTSPLHIAFQKDLPLLCETPSTYFEDDLKLQNKLIKRGMVIREDTEFGSINQWIRQSFDEIQTSTITTINSFRCNGIYTPSLNGEIGTRLANGNISWVDINISTISFSVDSDVKSLECKTELTANEPFTPARFEVLFHFSDLVKVTYSHHDCAITLLLTMSAFDKSGVEILESNNRHYLINELNHCGASIQKGLSSVPPHSQSRVTTRPKQSLETKEGKKVKIFVRRSEFRSFVDKLLSRGIIVSAEDEPDEINSTESLKWISSRNQSEVEQDSKKMSLQKTNQIELNTKYGLDNPSKIIYLIQKDSSTKKIDSIENYFSDQIYNGKLIGPERVDLGVNNALLTTNNQKRGKNSLSDQYEASSELNSSQIVTPAKASRREVDSEKFSLSVPIIDHDLCYKDDESPFSRRGNADTSLLSKIKASETSTAKITPTARASVQYASRDSQNCMELSFKGFQLNSQRPFLETISALLCATSTTDGNFNQSGQLMNLLKAGNTEGAGLAQTIFKIDETLTRAVGVIRELHNSVKQLGTYSSANDLRDSLGWVDDVFDYMSSGSTKWDNRKRAVGVEMENELLSAFGSK